MGNGSGEEEKKTTRSEVNVKKTVRSLSIDQRGQITISQGGKKTKQHTKRWSGTYSKEKVKRGKPPTKYNAGGKNREKSGHERKERTDKPATIEDPRGAGRGKKNTAGRNCKVVAISGKKKKTLKIEKWRGEPKGGENRKNVTSAKKWRGWECTKVQSEHALRGSAATNII